MRRRHALPVALALVALSAGGCSQAAQLRGVAGADISAVRTATNDVLVAKSIDIRVAPTCQFDDPAYVCAGTTITGEAIGSTAVVRAEYGASTDPYGAYVPADVSLVVTVGGMVIYDGTVHDVLQSAGEVAE